MANLALKALTTLMCIYTGLANVKNPSKGVQWASVVMLILFNLVNGISWIWLGEVGLYRICTLEANNYSFPAFLYAVEILPLQYRSQVQSASNLVFWFVAFLAVYFGGQAASDPNVGALIYIWFCLGGGIITILSWIFVAESKSRPHNCICHCTYLLTLHSLNSQRSHT